MHRVSGLYSSCVFTCRLERDFLKKVIRQMTMIMKLFAVCVRMVEM